MCKNLLCCQKPVCARVSMQDAHAVHIGCRRIQIAETFVRKKASSSMEPKCRQKMIDDLFVPPYTNLQKLQIRSGVCAKHRLKELLVASSFRESVHQNTNNVKLFLCDIASIIITQSLHTCRSLPLEMMKISPEIGFLGSRKV